MQFTLLVIWLNTECHSTLTKESNELMFIDQTQGRKSCATDRIWIPN